MGLSTNNNKEESYLKNSFSYFDIIKTSGTTAATKEDPAKKKKWWCQDYALPNIALKMRKDPMKYERNEKIITEFCAKERNLTE